MDAALESLADKYEKRGEAELFAELKRFLPGADGPAPHSEIAQRTGKSEAALRMAISRLRREFGAALRNAVRQTVSDAHELEEEMRELMAALSP